MCISVLPEGKQRRVKHIVSKQSSAACNQKKIATLDEINERLSRAFIFFFCFCCNVKSLFSFHSSDDKGEKHVWYVFVSDFKV